VLAQRGVYDQVVAGLQQAAGRLKVGDPLEPDTVVGPLISGVQRDRVEALIRTGVAEGGEVVAGGGRPDLPTGFYVEPTLIAGCKPDNPAVLQEFFGPVVVVVPFDDEDEAVAIANGTEFGLYDYVFSTDTAKAFETAQQLRTGTVGLNTAQRNHEAPFGGFKMSGVGRDGGSWGLHAYSELQSIVWPG
jgi:acyl-CoA reductase-like NAD-dependent aldehyde dehydrogenase